MTREEAVKIWEDEVVSKQRVGITADVIRGFVALGMLKLDEPKSINERAIDALFAGSKSGVITPRHALDALSAANLKITEK